MIKMAIMSAVASRSGTALGVHGAYARESMLQGTSTKDFRPCAKKCQKTFYFSEQSGPGLRCHR